MSDEYRETHSWEGTKTANDHFELIVLNDTREAWKGTWKVERVTLTGEVLATQSFDDVELGAVCHIGLPLADEIVSYVDAGNELVVATPSDNAFARVIFNPAEIIDQKLTAPAEAFSTAAVAVEDGVELTVTAKSYVRDLFCMADKVDAKASVAEAWSRCFRAKASCCISPPPMPQRLPLRVRSQPPTCCVPPTI